MIRLVAIGGTGDAYLVSALAAVVSRLYRAPVVVATKARYAVIPAMFAVPFEHADEEIRRAETDPDMQRDYDNRVADGATFYVHPSFTRSGARLDHLTMLPHSPSQADMYREMLGLPLGEPLALPSFSGYPAPPNRAILIPDAVSWPNTQPAFWAALARDLAVAGYDVAVNDPAWSLDELLRRCYGAELVVGPQCGVVSIVCAAEFPCRKIVATPSIDDGPGFPVGRHLLRRTYPYAYVAKFTGQDYDVDEYRVTDDNHAEIIGSIIASPRGSRDPRPVAAVEAALFSPGDFLDRLAILTVKRTRFDAERAAAVEREYLRYVEIARTLDLSPEVDHYFESLVSVHFRTFDLLARTVVAPGPDDHRAAFALNRKRVGIKAAIDRATRAPYGEVKDYYGAEAADD